MIQIYSMLTIDKSFKHFKNHLEVDFNVRLMTCKSQHSARTRVFALDTKSFPISSNKQFIFLN